MKKIKQFTILQKHFFNSLFQNEIVPYAEEMRAVVIVILAILAVFGGFLANSLLFQYLFSVKPADPSDSWIYKCYFIAFFMVIMGFISSLELNWIFSGRLDYINLFHLPINPFFILLS